MARCIIQQFQPRMDSNEELTKELWLAQKAALEAEIAGLNKQVELLEEVRDGLKRELEMVNSSTHKKNKTAKTTAIRHPCKSQFYNREHTRAIFGDKCPLTIKNM